MRSAGGTIAIDRGCVVYDLVPAREAGRHRRVKGKAVVAGRSVDELHGKRLVLLPSKNDAGAVLLEAREPEKFVEDVRRKW